MAAPARASHYEIKLEVPPSSASSATDLLKRNDANKGEDLSAAANEKPGSQLEASQSDPLSFYLRNIKRIALVLIASCICVGAAMSKVSLVSITDRMNPRFNLSFPDEYSPPHRSMLFIQLMLLLVIPEAVSFIRCLVWGVIGKTTRSFPWPSRSALILVSRSTKLAI